MSTASEEALESDGLPSRERLRQMPAARWAEWMIALLKGDDPVTRRPPRRTDTPLETVRRAGGKACDTEAEKRHFYGALEAVDSLARDLSLAPPGAEAVSAGLANRLGILLWHLASTALPEFRAMPPAEGLAEQLSIWAATEGPLRLPALQSLKALRLPGDPNFWRPLLGDRATALLAFEALVERNAGGLPAALKGVLGVLRETPWLVTDLLGALADGYGLPWTQALVDGAVPSLGAEERATLHDAVRGSGIRPPDPIDPTVIEQDVAPEYEPLVSHHANKMVGGTVPRPAGASVPQPVLH